MGYIGFLVAKALTDLCSGAFVGGCRSEEGIVDFRYFPNRIDEKIYSQL